MRDVKSPPISLVSCYREGERASRRSVTMLDRRLVSPSRCFSLFFSFFIGSRTALRIEWRYMPVLVLSLVHNATLAGKRSTLYIFRLYRIIIHLLCGSATSLKYGRSIQVYTHVCTARRERDRRLPRSIPKYRIVWYFHLKRSITGRGERRERKRDQ